VPSKETTMKTPIRTLGATGVTKVLTAGLIGVTDTASSATDGTTVADQPPWHGAHHGATES
jgi:hypothetical protein